MNILHATSWLSRNGGGVPPIIRGLAEAQKAGGQIVEVIGLDDEFAREDTAGWTAPVHLCPIRGPLALGFSPEFRSRLSLANRPVDIVHFHGLWMWPGYAARKFAESKKAPLILATHGMAEPWALSRSRWKKRIAAILFEQGNFRATTCFHVGSNQEYENVRALGLKNPVAVVPNAVELSEYANLPPADALAELFPRLRGRRLALFLARIHPKKGIPHLLKAWASITAEFDNWTLLIAGPDQMGHTAEMEDLARSLSIEARVLFTGPLYGTDKAAAMAASALFVLPSFSEGFSMAILEAAASGLPVVMTPQCNFSTLASAGGAIEIEPNESDTAKGLREIMSLSDSERRSIGQKGKHLVHQEHTWPKIAKDTISVYEWALGLGPKPDTVRLD